MEADAKWIDENVEEVDSGKGEFKMELWLSTDNKNTVKVEATTPHGRKEAAKYAVAMRKWLLDNFGSKQGFATKEYTKAESELGVCKDCGAANLKSSKGNLYCSKKCWLKK